MAFLLVLAAAAVNQFESILIKKYNERYDKGGMIFTSVVSLFSMLFFVIADLVADENKFTFTPEIVLCGAVAGVAFCAASVLTFVALGCGSFVLTRLVLSYGVLIAVFHGLFLGERLSAFGIAGVALVLVSLFLVKGKDEGTVKTTKKWVITIGLSVLLAGAFGILQRQQQRRFDHFYDNEFMMIALGVSAVILFIGGLIKDGRDVGYILVKGGPYACGAGLSNGATNFLTLFAYSLAPMSIVAPLNSGAGIVVSFIVAKLLFREKFSALQYVGVVLGGVALILFNL